MNALARRAAGLLLSTIVMPLVAVAADVQPTHEFTLDNGLKVIVREDHRAPVVTQMVWYRVGAADEAPGHSGIAEMECLNCHKIAPPGPAITQPHSQLQDQLCLDCHGSYALQ